MACLTACSRADRNAFRATEKCKCLCCVCMCVYLCVNVWERDSKRDLSFLYKCDVWCCWHSFDASASFYLMVYTGIRAHTHEPAHRCTLTCSFSLTSVNHNHYIFHPLFLSFSVSCTVSIIFLYFELNIYSHHSLHF